MTEIERPSSSFTGNTSNLNGTPKKDESPDLDRIQVKTRHDTSEVLDKPVLDSRSSSNTKWYKLVAVKDGKLVSVVNF